jgi:hypothetical protein
MNSETESLQIVSDDLFEQAQRRTRYRSNPGQAAEVRLQAEVAVVGSADLRIDAVALTSSRTLGLTRARPT